MELFQIKDTEGEILSVFSTNNSKACYDIMQQVELHPTKEWWIDQFKRMCKEASIQIEEITKIQDYTY